MVNKRALSDYEVLESWEAGMVLTGAEVKSAKKGAVSLTGSRAVVMGDVGPILHKAIKDSKPEIWLVGMQISPYEYSGDENYDPIRRRKLLLKRKEIEEIAERVAQKGLTLVPLKCYNKGGLVKLELALVRGKKKYEKREELKKREVTREIERLVKKRRLN